MTKQTPSIRTPLNQVLGLGSAKEGGAHWWTLRITSLPLVPLFFYFITQLQFLASTERMEFVKWLKKPVPAIAVILFVLCSFYHSCLGMEEVIEDYVHSPRLKGVCLILNKILFFVLGVVAVYSVLAIGFKKF